MSYSPATMMKAIALALCLLTNCMPCAAQSTSFAQLEFLLGSWKGSGSGDPGRGTGEFTFTRELDGRVMVRRAHSTYPPANGRPAVTHDDLMIVHSRGTLADYFDNEGHVIHYRITAGDDGASATFLSLDPPPSPLFRLTYTRRPTGDLSVRFEISRTGKIEDLKTYLDGMVQRKPQ